LRTETPHILFFALKLAVRFPERSDLSSNKSLRFLGFWIETVYIKEFTANSPLEITVPRKALLEKV
jgi:hypothetical protein